MKIEYVFKKPSNFMKIRPVGAELYHERRQTDMTKRTVFFRHFASARKSVWKDVWD